MPTNNTIMTKHQSRRPAALFAIAAALLTLAPLLAQDSPPASPAPATPPANPVHTELRALKADLLEAIKARDIEAMVKHTTPDVVVTWQNNEVCRGQDELREFYTKMGKDTFKSYKVDPTADHRTTMFENDAGVVAGHSVGSYALMGKEYDFENRWTATVVKVDGKWLVASYHVSLNALDNPIVNTATSGLYWALGGGLLLGLVVGFIIFRRKTA
jgi:uncharacterized protein (TIGR02246 family)